MFYQSNRLQSAVFLLLFFFIFSLSCKQQADHSEDDIVFIEQDSTQHIYRYGICIDSLNVEEFRIKRGDSQSLIFTSLGFSASKADSISRVVAGILEPTKIRAGHHYYTFSTQDSIAPSIRYIAFAKSLTDFAVIDLTEDTVSVREFKKSVVYRQKYLEGTINTSLYNDIEKMGSDPLLALEFSNVYAWQIDFFDVKKGDSFQVIYDVAFIDDTTELRISSITGAIFTHQGKNYMALPFTQDSVFEYFDEEGNSLRKAFLKAPLDFFRITSRFSNARFHPILKRYRAHHGVDYAAPVGTPVKTIGDGTVVARTYQGGGGNYVKIKHNSVYTTTYMHLSRFAAGLRVGSRVRQGEVIGYVGSTGLSTGPHLDFRVYKNGQPINPLNMESPPSLPVKPELRDSFAIVKQQILAKLDSCHRAFININQ